MKKLTEFELGIIGSVFGLVGSILTLTDNGFSEVVSNNANEVQQLGWTAIICSIVGIIGALITKYNPQIGGLILLVASAGGIMSIFVIYIMPGLLMIVAGFSGIKKE